MKRVLIPMVIVLVMAASTWAVVDVLSVQRAICTVAASSMYWKSVAIAEVDVSDPAMISGNTECMQYIREAVDRQAQLVELYALSTVSFQGYEYTAAAGQVAAMKIEFAALRTRVKAVEDMITAN